MVGKVLNKSVEVELLVIVEVGKFVCTRGVIFIYPMFDVGVGV